MDLTNAYAFAASRLLSIEEFDVAERFIQRGPSLDRHPMAVAVLAAVDGVNARRAAATDQKHAAFWRAIADDQAQISRKALSLAGMR